MKKLPRKRLFESLEDRQVLNVGPISVLHLEEGASAWTFSNDDFDTTIEAHNDVTQNNSFNPVGVGDFNGDNVDDILGTSDDNEWLLQINDGTQLFTVDFGNPVSQLEEIIGTADFDGDGNLDVVSRDANNNLIVSTNEGATLVNRAWGSISEAPTFAFVDDFDGDDDPDVLTGTIGGRWNLARNEGNQFVNADWANLGPFGWTDVVTGDFNGDQIADVAGLAGDQTWWLWTGTSDVAGSAQFWGHWKMRDTWMDVNTGDFNDDGRDDLIGRTEDGRLWVGTATDTRFHTWTWDDGWVNRADWRNVSIVDIDDDGLPDQVGQASDNSWYYALNRGNATFDNFFWHNFETPGYVELVESFDREEAVDVIGSLPPEGLNPNANPILVSLDDNDNIVLTGSGEQVIGLELVSASGSLIPSAGDVADPFQFLLSNFETGVTFGSLSSGPTIDGDVTLPVQWDVTSSAADLVVRYGPADTDVLLPSGVLAPLGDFVPGERTNAEANLVYYASLA